MIANLITGFRILCSVVLLLCPTGSAAFYTVYLLAGLSDMVDGTVARKTHSAGDFGARLDTAADAVFFAAAFGKLLPTLTIPVWLWLWIGIILLLKCAALAAGLVGEKRLTMHHTVLNKITGAALFLLPLTLRWIALSYSAVPVCLLATAAAAQEWYLQRKREKSHGR